MCARVVVAIALLAVSASALSFQKKGPLDDQADGSCCGTCFAPDHVVALDRHFAIDSPYKMDTQCDGAPSFCKGPGPAAVCFQPSCAAGFKAHCAPGECCPKCVPESA